MVCGLLINHKQLLIRLYRLFNSLIFQFVNSSHFFWNPSEINDIWKYCYCNFWQIYHTKTLSLKSTHGTVHNILYFKIQTVSLLYFLLKAINLPFYQYYDMIYMPGLAWFIDLAWHDQTQYSFLRKTCNYLIYNKS